MLVIVRLSHRDEMFPALNVGEDGYVEKAILNLHEW